MTEESLTHDLVSSLLEYDPLTGILTWAVDHSARARKGHIAGYAHNDGYRAIRINNVSAMVHRVIWFIVHSEWPYKIDHINGIRDDNRLCNLRNVSHQGNMRNMALSKINTSGIVGVGWNKRINKWRARISIGGGNTVMIGAFDSLLEACCARKSAEIEHGYHKNHGRMDASGQKDGMEQVHSR